MQAINPQPQLPAAEFEVLKVFFEGKNTCPGAYRIGEMMSYAGHIRARAEKLSDPYERYVQEDINSSRRGTNDPDLCRQIDGIDRAAACRFVREILHFPLENGTLLRNQMGNLEEITASRNALRLYLRTHTSVPPELIDNPQRVFNDTCNRLVRDAWKYQGPSLEKLDDASIRYLLRLNVLMNALDFHSPDFHDLWRCEKSIGGLINEQFDKAREAEFSPRLGGDRFCDEFFRRWLAQGRAHGADGLFCGQQWSGRRQPQMCGDPPLSATSAQGCFRAEKRTAWKRRLLGRCRGFARSRYQGWGAHLPEAPGV